jgi:CRP-like cAMP-binding protein
MIRKQVQLALNVRGEPFFNRLSERVLERVERLVYHREYEARQIVFFPDDPCDYVYWIREGRVRVSRVPGDGRELTFRHLLPGDVMGEECLTGRQTRYDYAEAMLPSVLCLMRAEDFRRMAMEEAEFSSLVALKLCERVIETERVLAETVFNSVRGRIAAGLLRLYNREGRHNDGHLQITHQEMANLVGSTRETTTLVLHGLRKEGIVTLSNRRLTVLDPGALEHLARNG